MGRYEVVVEKLINNGCGLARDREGKVLFLPGALAGERWEITGTQKKKGALWAKANRLSDAPVRAVPNCPHYEDCGGCSLLHVGREHELAVKLSYLKDVLRRLGHAEIENFKTHDFDPNGSRIRGKFHVDEEGRIGFYKEGAHTVADITTCHVLPPAVMALLPKLRETVAKTHFRGEIYFLTNADGEKPILELLGRCKGKQTVQQWEHTGAAALILRGPEVKNHLTIGNPVVIFEWGKQKVYLGPKAFVQSNPASWPFFYKMVQRYLNLSEPVRIWDLYAGAGFLCGAIEDRELWVSEPNPTAYEQLRLSLANAGKRAHVFMGTAEEAIQQHFFRPEPGDGLILDPPREGLSGELRQWILEHGPKSLLYFSCDMGSFARDLRSLSEQYKLEEPLVVKNVNPGTLRVELGAIFLRKEQEPETNTNTP